MPRKLLIRVYENRMEINDVGNGKSSRSTTYKSLSFNQIHKKNRSTHWVLIQRQQYCVFFSSSLFRLMFISLSHLFTPFFVLMMVFINAHLWLQTMSIANQNKVLICHGFSFCLLYGSVSYWQAHLNHFHTPCVRFSKLPTRCNHCKSMAVRYSTLEILFGTGCSFAYDPKRKVIEIARLPKVIKSTHNQTTSKTTQIKQSEWEWMVML